MLRAAKRGMAVARRRKSLLESSTACLSFRTDAGGQLKRPFEGNASALQQDAKRQISGSSPRRYCLLDVGYAFEKHDYANAFLKFFGDEGETWEVYHPREGNWPDHRNEKFDAFVIGGSWADAYANDEWIVKLRDYVRSLYEHQRRIFGCCFGAQIVAHSLGGKTAPSTTGWEIGVVECTTMPAFKKKWYAGEASAFPASFGIHQSHYDQVMELPEGAERFFSSATTPNEGFGIGDTVLCIQGHPEWDDNMTSKLLDLRVANRALSDEVAQRMQKTLGTQRKDDALALADMCKRFLKTPEYVRSPA